MWASKVMTMMIGAGPMRAWQLRPLTAPGNCRLVRIWQPSQNRHHKPCRSRPDSQLCCLQPVCIPAKIRHLG
jgi:hypothetical protein